MSVHVVFYEAVLKSLCLLLIKCTCAHNSLEACLNDIVVTTVVTAKFPVDCCTVLYAPLQPEEVRHACTNHYKFSASNSKHTNHSTGGLKYCKDIHVRCMEDDTPEV